MIWYVYALLICQLVMNYEKKVPHYYQDGWSRFQGSSEVSLQQANSMAGWYAARELNSPNLFTILLRVCN